MHDLLQISIMLELGNFQQQRILFVHCTSERQRRTRKISPVLCRI